MFNKAQLITEGDNMISSCTDFFSFLLSLMNFQILTGDPIFSSELLVSPDRVNPLHLRISDSKAPALL